MGVCGPMDGQISWSNMGQTKGQIVVRELGIGRKATQIELWDRVHWLRKHCFDWSRLATR